MKKWGDSSLHKSISLATIEPSLLYPLQKRRSCQIDSQPNDFAQQTKMITPVLHCPQKKLILPKVPTTKTMEARLPPFFFLRTFRFSALAPNVSIESKFDRPDMSSLVHSRECAKATALFASSFSFDSRKKVLGYGTRNRTFKRLEPHFQSSATRSAPKENTKRAVALAHSRRESAPRSSYPGYQILARWKCSEPKQKNEMSSGKTAADVLPLVLKRSTIEEPYFF